MTGAGLASDGWWRGCSKPTADRAREWVRFRLLDQPHMTDAECDRFIASLSEEKREALIRRAVNNLPAANF